MVDKPRGPTSHDVVARVRQITRTRRVGHTGTLDPMATGVLVLCLGKATRLIPYIEEMCTENAKEYEASIRFGFETTTDDAEGEPRSEAGSTAGLTTALIASALSKLVGRLEQVPPAYSAKKIAGERAYSIARRGEDVDLRPVSVHVAVAELLSMQEAFARVRIVCSRGTYIRALARDLGRELKVGAHLVELRRTRSGTASIGQAMPLGSLTADSVVDMLVPMASILDAWPKHIVGDREAADLRMGRPIKTGGDLRAAAGDRIRVCDHHDGLVALALAESFSLRPFCVF